MQKPLIFISHITEEKEIALGLKKLVQGTFLNMIDVFVSSDPTSIKMGRKWLEEITLALKTCAVEIILASPRSVTRPWINFEGGSAWVRDIPVIPLCHSGMVPTKLPAPLGALQAATATEEPELALVFPVLAEAIGCTLPEIRYSEFIETVKKFEQESHDFQRMTEQTPILMTDGLSQHELAALVEVADQTFTSGEAIPAHSVRNPLERAGYTGVAVALALKMLARKDLVEFSNESDGNYNEYTAVKVSTEGWNWLEANQDKLCLTREVSPEDTTGPLPNRSQGDEIPF